MATLAELYTSIEEDNLAEIEEAIKEYELPTVVEIAASYSTRQRQVSPKMTRLILQRTIESISIHHMIWSADQIINGGDEFVPSEAIMTSFEFLIFTQPEPENEKEFKTVSRRLVQVIGTCQEPEFQQILSFAAEGEIAMALPDEIMLAMAERIKRILQDDRAFFLILQSAIMTALLEASITAAIVSSDAETRMLEELRAQGYEVEAMPEINGVFMIDTQDDSNGSTTEAYQPATRSSDWFVQNSRHRRRGRRYGN
ncbi:hypothetical protein IKE80_01100 [Candidatus Saccharibacteria bacterium]|nr:hypothetical protein [Candidatus Saccharibacteria bacterium]